MNIKGKLKKKLDLVTGTSKAGKEWQKQSFVIDTGAKYNNIICIEAFGDKVQDLNNVSEGDTLDVQININCNEYKGKYYTSLQAWSISVVDGGEPFALADNLKEANDDLPY
jgi:hypothetical protein